MSERLQGVSAHYHYMCDKCFFFFFSFNPITRTPPHQHPILRRSKVGSCPQCHDVKCHMAQMGRWRARSAAHVSKVSQIMAPDRSSHRKMTNPGQNGLSSTFSGKFPIKMLIQTVGGGRKKKGRKNTIWRSRSRQCFPSFNQIPSSVLWRMLQAARSSR